jgi:hypothetical protein
LVLSRYQAERRPDLPALVEAARGFEGQHEGKRSDWTNAVDAAESLAVRVLGCAEVFDLAIVALDLLVERVDCLQNGQQSGLERFGKASSCLGRKAVCGAQGDASACALHDASHMVDQQCPGPHQGIP